MSKRRKRKILEKGRNDGEMGKSEERRKIKENGGGILNSNESKTQKERDLGDLEKKEELRSA